MVVDLFAGPGGWDLAAHELGLAPVGIEWDDAACKTREAAGLQTRQADVFQIDPTDYEGCELLIASPPCQAFSMAGSGAGRKAMGAYVEAIKEFRHTAHIDYGKLDAACDDERAHLVLEPLRWAEALRPDYIALEQVKPVLPLWEGIAGALMDMGYRTWTGVLSAERYGVPQTRERAILLASLKGDVSMPPPTHQRYVAGRKKPKQEETLFDAPEPERIVLPEDRHLLPWVSMAQALGWTDGEAPSPAPSVTGGGGATGGVEVFASKGARERVGRSVAFRATNERPNVALRDSDEPAPSLAFGHNPPRWVTERPSTAVMGDARIAPPGYRGGKADYEEGKQPDSMFTPKAQVRNPGPGAERDPRSLDDPSYTIRSAGSGSAPAGVEWVDDRPSTTVAGDQRLFPPRRTDRNPDYQPGDPAQPMAGEKSATVRVALSEALVLQSFPPDYPVQGNKSKQFEQVGNAVPPLLAYRILEHLLCCSG